MKTKNVQRTDQINLFVDESFLFCLEMGKGFIKRNLNLLNITDYSFENVISAIEGLSKAEMIQKGLDRVLFVNGSIFESKLITEVVKEELSLIPIGVHTSVVDSIIEEKKAVSRYFSVSTLDSIKTMLNNANFIADGKISITENIAVGSTVSNDMILINMSNYNYELQNYTDIFEFTNGILKTKGNIDYETRLNYVLQIKISDKLDASKFWMDTIDVDVINVGDTLTLNTIRTTHIAENSSNGSVLGDLNTLFTKEAGMNISLSLNNYTDKFSISNGNLVVNGTLDYETKASYTVSVKITNTDNVSQFWDMDVNVTIDNAGDTITLSTSRSMNIDQKVATGTVIGDLTTLFTKEVGLDVSMAVTTYTDKFSISGNNLIVNGVLDYAVTPQYIVTVRLTNTANTSMVWDMDVTVGINNTITGPVTITYKTDIFGDGSGIALYKFDGNANDEGGNYHGTETAITYGGGVYGRAAVFSGSALVDLPTTTNAIAYPHTLDQTLSYFIKTTLSTNYQGLPGIGSCFSTANVPNGYVYFGTTNNVSGYARLFQVPVSMINTNNWIHIVISHSSVNGTSLYIDGIQFGTTITTYGGGPGYTLNTNHCIGRTVDGGSSHFIGSLDQVRFFKRALTASEVQILLKEPKPTSTVTFPARVIDKLPVAHYKFEGDVKDAMGSYNGTATNVTYAPGKFGTAAVFNGSNSYVTLGSIELTNNISVSMYFKMNVAPTSAQSMLFTLAGDAYSPYILITVNNTGQLTGVLRDTTGNNTTSANCPYGSIGSWNHVAFVRESSVSKLYFNGQLVSTTTGSVSGSYGVCLATIGRYIGAGDASPLAGTYFNGSIDQTRIFNSALTQEEVTALFNEQPPADTIDDAIAFYKLDGNAEDALGNYNGVATNVTYLDSKFGKAGVFNGISSKIVLPSSPLFVGDFAVSMWVNLANTTGYKGLLDTRLIGTWLTGMYLQVVNASLRFYGNNNIYYDCAYTLQAATDYHILVKRTGTTVTIFINNSLVFTNTFSGSLSTSSVITIGAESDNIHWMNGSIDQVRIYNRALNATEVGMLFNEASPIETVSYTKPVIQNDAIAHYKLDGDAKDAMGTYNGTATAVTYADGKFGKAAVFNGSNSRISLGSFLTVTNSYSFSIWVKTTSLSKYIVDLYGWGGELSTTNQGYALFQIYNGTTWSSITSTQSISDNLWHNIVCLHDASAKAIKMYIDGTFVNSVSYTGTIRTIGSISIGSTYVPDIFFNGSIDQLRFYDRALGQSEVTALFNEVLPTSTKNLLLDEAVAYYKMDGNANDSMGNYNGTISGTVSYADSSFGKKMVSSKNGLIKTGISYGSNSTPYSISMLIEVADFTSTFAIWQQYRTGFIIKNGVIGFVVFDSNNSYTQEVDAPITAGVLTHIVGIFDGNKIKIYKDGSFISEMTVTSFSSTATSTAGLGLGGYIANDNTTPYYTLSGSLDQVRIYDRAITAAEVTTLFNEAVPTSIVDNTNPFNDGSCKAMYQFNGDATDKNGVYNGAATNVTYGTGKFGQCAVFNGTNYILTPSYGGLSTFSYSFWINPTNASTANKYIIGHQTSPSFAIQADSGVLKYYSTDVSTQSFSPAIAISNSTWQHFCIVHDGMTVKAYKDGRFVGSLSYPSRTLSSLYIGTPSTQVGNSTYAIQGNLDQVRIFNKALTSQEIQDLFIEGQYPRTTLPAIELDPFKDNSCKALYKFEGNALDSNGKYDGVATNVTYATGKFGQCAVFNGSSSAILLNQTIIGATAKGTLSIWLKGSALLNATTTAQTFFYNRSPYFILNTYNGNLDFTIKNSASTNTTISRAVSNFNSTSWYHIVCTSEGINGTMKMFVNGILVGTAIVPSTIINVSNHTVIGASYDVTSGYAQWSNSMIDQLRVFDKALTSSEVQDLFIEGQYNKVELPALELQPFADKSCKSYYKFDGNVLDSLGNSNGVATNVSYAQSKFGQCAVFNGTSSAADLGDILKLIGNSTISIVARWKTISSGENALIWRWNSGGITTSSVTGNVAKVANKISYALMHSDGTWKIITSNDTIVLNRWYHIVVQNVNGVSKMYVDGVLQNDTISVTHTAPLASTKAVVGAYAPTNTSYLGFANVDVDQLRIFDKLLTPMEVAALYTETTPTEFPMSHQVDPFKDGSGKALYKLDGNANDESGNYNGTATALTYGNGQFGRYSVFNGTSGRINIANNNVFNVNTTGTITISAFVKLESTDTGGPVFSTSVDGVANSAADLSYTAYVYNNQVILYVAYDNTYAQITTLPMTLNDGILHHYVFIIQNNNYHKVYKDGVLIGTSSTIRTTTNSIKTVRIGFTRQGYFKGSIDQVRILSRALTQEEIQTLSNEL